MGYTSNLIIRCKKFKADELLQFLATQDLQDCISDLVVSSEYIQFTMHSIKWYESYSDVKAVNQFINDNQEHMCMLRIGDDMDDIEEYGACNNHNLTYHFILDINQLNGTSVTLTNKSLSEEYPELFI